MTACPNCTGTRYLADQPGLGPCTCVTPEAMRAESQQKVRLAQLVMAAHEKSYGGRDIRPGLDTPWYAMVVEARRALGLADFSTALRAA